jgi:transporter family-2 protein
MGVVTGILFITIGILAGMSIVLSRMLNAELANHIGVEYSTLANYITGFGLSLVIWLAAGAMLPEFSRSVAPVGWYIWLGGTLGVGFVALSNQVSLKLSALVMTLLVFVSQQAVGLALDAAATGAVSAKQIAGALVLAAGLLVYQSDARETKME